MGDDFTFSCSVIVVERHDFYPTCSSSASSGLGKELRKQDTKLQEFESPSGCGTSGSTDVMDWVLPRY